MSDPFATLDTLHAHIWTRLQAGARDAADPFRRTVLATTGPQGAEARIVGLRYVDPKATQIEVHSDMRTDKVRALLHDPRATLLFWDAEQELQVRVTARLMVEQGRQDRWDAIPDAARLNYGTDPAPGTPLQDPTAYDRTPSPTKFAALRGAVLGFDVVSLRHDPHRRAMFDIANGSGNWVAP